MKKQIIEHSLSIIFIAFVFTVLLVSFNTSENDQQSAERPLLHNNYRIKNFDYNNPLHKSLLNETLNIFYNQSSADSLQQLYKAEFNQQSINPENRTAYELNTDNTIKILMMFLKFLFVYILVLSLTYYGVQTLAVYRFVTTKQNKSPLIVRAVSNLNKLKKGISFKNASQIILKSLSYLIQAIVKLILYLILFSPAYVIAYSFKTKFDTDSIIFMIILGVISNALLITYSQKFYTFLVTESNKGYVETAVVKNLKNDYSFKVFQVSSILNIKKIFPGHVFNHIFINAQHQYFSTIKEQAAFLITGLIIIEMALNIHGHLSYELMQNLLYQQFQLVLVILFLMYLTVKATEIFVDIFIFKLNKKYQNN